MVDRCIQRLAAVQSRLTIHLWRFTVSRSVAAGFVLLVALSASAQPAGGPVKELTLDPQPFDDTAEILKIVKRSGRVKLAAHAPRGRLVVEFFAGGKQDGEVLRRSGVGYDVSIRPEPVHELQFAAQFADLDYLPLGNGSKDNTRLLLELRVEKGIMDTAVSMDVPKAVFDPSTGVGGGAFEKKDATASEVPLFWMVARTNSVKTGFTPRDIIANHPGAQVAIVTLRLGEEK
jgi:hypothetical protein